MSNVPSQLVDALFMFRALPPYMSGGLIAIAKRGLAVKKAVKGVAAVTKTREIPVETDVEKLVNFCCINYRIDEHPVPLKADSEYPDWLWSMRVSRRPPRLSDIDPDSYYYWRRVRRLHNRHLNNLAAIHGWHRREHRDPRSHSERAYGYLYYALQKRFWHEDPPHASN